MSVVINTNTAATIAANNLSDANRMLQKSLNRLSSGSKITSAADDAGGVAVAARLSGAAVRSQGAISNISSALSFLQQQDSALKVGAKIVQRMNELQVLFRDQTKTAGDKANYTTEYDKLKVQYFSAVKSAKYNTIGLLSSIAVSVDEQLNSYALADLTGVVNNSSTWDITNGGDFASATGTKGVATVGAAGNLVLKHDSVTITIALASTDTMSAVINKVNNYAGGKVVASLTSNGYLKLSGTVAGEKLYIMESSDNDVTTALGLTEADAGVASSSTPDSVLAEIQNLATARAKNGADQSVLQYHSELAMASKANFESAVSRIMDVDVAQESTQLARWNTLVQAGTAMMAQANGATLSALSLLKG